ncbi:hypothetical protein ACQHIH_16135 [Xanthomonas sontii]|uniref:hypothetical protein n=1 Tax=Xanthomonas sontii TaxID=2650745 RepID=UPI00388B3FB5
MNKSILALALVMLSGCASYKTKLESWQGQPVGALIAAWGPPQSSYDLPDGSQVIQYIQSGNMTLPGMTYTMPQTTYQQGNVSAYGSNGYANGTYSGTSTSYVQQRMPDTNISLSCTTQFTVNPGGVITGFSYRGNNC